MVPAAPQAAPPAAASVVAVPAAGTGSGAGVLTGASLIGSSREDSGDAYKPWPQAGGEAALACPNPGWREGAPLQPAAPAAPSKHTAFIAGYMSAADLARLDAYDPFGAAGFGSAPSSLGGSAAGSECGDMAPFVPPPGGAAAAAARALSRLGAPPGAGLPRPESASSFFAAAQAAAESSEVVTFNWSKKSHRSTAEAALNTLVVALADDPVNSFLLGGTPSARFARKEIKGYLKALPKAAHFIATKDSAAVALWQLLPHETPRNELLAGWTR